MFRCPRCDVPLETLRKKGLCIWACGDCDGRLATVTTLRRALEPGFVSRLWSIARAHAGASLLECPGCRRSMRASAAPHGGGRLHFDACLGCQFVWFDRGEYEGSPPKPAEPKPGVNELSPKARAAAAEFLVRDTTREAATVEPDDVVLWRGLEGFGTPTERGSSFPWLAWTLAIASVLASVWFAALAPEGRDSWIEALSTWTRWTWSSSFAYLLVDGLASFCLHTNMVVLVTNLALLLVFVPAVEEARGRARLFLLITIAAIAGALAGHAAPPLGAGAGLTAAVTWYGLEYPRVRLAIHARFRRSKEPPSISARALLVLWCVLQGGIAVLLGDGHFAAAAAAGFAVGFVAWGFPRTALMHGAP